MCERRFTKSGWSEDEHMVECFPTISSSGNENLHLLTYAWLTAVVCKRLGTNGAIKYLVAFPRDRTGQPIMLYFCHLNAPPASGPVE